MRVKRAADRRAEAPPPAAACEGGPAGACASGAGGRHGSRRGDGELGELCHAEERRKAGGGPCGFRVRFTEAVQGPVAVGYASHFGLGGFVGGKPID